MEAEIKKTESQNKGIARFLINGGQITSLEALRMFGCLRLSGRIYDLKNQGFGINKVMVQRGEKRVALYSLRKS